MIDTNFVLYHYNCPKCNSILEFCDYDDDNDGINETALYNCMNHKCTFSCFSEDISEHSKPIYEHE